MMTFPEAVNEQSTPIDAKESCDDAVLVLPQPKQVGAKKYSYYVWPTLPPSLLNLQSNQLVWVCKSKGGTSERCNLQQRHRDEDKDMNSSNVDDDAGEEYADHAVESMTEKERSCCSQKNGIRKRKHELFLRARVVVPRDANEIPGRVFTGSNNDYCDDHNRILVRYARGSTYHARRDHLLPVLERHDCTVVLICAETPNYRKSCVQHTTPDESFVEFGCDMGQTVHRVAMTGYSHHRIVPVVMQQDDHENKQESQPQQRNVLQQDDERQPGSMVERLVVGVDKCPISIATAKARYPALQFVVWDILANENIPDVLSPFQSRAANDYGDVRCHGVVALDINGTRAWKTVVVALQRIMDTFQPRLIVCKSREHAAMIPLASGV